MAVDNRVQPRRSLGQNFLTDSRLASGLIATAGLAPGQEVIEIGPGEGTLTEALLASGMRVAAVEIDARLIPILEGRFGGRPGFRLVQADALTLDYSRLIHESGFHPPVAVVGNFPYNVGTPLIRALVTRRGVVRQVTAMLQDEVARRIAARPGDSAYGYLSVYCQYYAVPSLGPLIRPGAFRPRPRVMSRLVRLDLREAPQLSPALEDTFLRLISRAFRHPRKILGNNLSGPDGLVPDVKPFLTAHGYSPLARPGELALDAWLDLSRAAGAAPGECGETSVRPSYDP